MGYKIGIDVGGTNIVCGVIDGDGRLIGKLKRPTESRRGFAAVIDRIAAMVSEVLDAHGIARTDVEAIGAGIPGFVDPLQGVVRKAGNLGWDDAPVAEALGVKTGLPVFIDNDVRMYVFGEAMCGAGRGFDVVLGLTVGTGMAAAVVDHGRLYYGGGFMAGELGHIRMEGIDYACGCGMTGCLETVVSATGIARLGREKAAAGATVLADWFGGKPDELTAADVSRAYDLGDAAAIEVMDKVGTMLGRGLSYATTLFSPDVIVIGGGAAQAGERLLQPMREELRRLVHPMYWERLAIRTAELADDAGVIGSATYAADRLARSRMPG
jgi:glucokinase